MLDFLSALFQSLTPLWEMGVTAAYAAAVVIVLRLLLKKRAPRQVLCLLWLVVFARLLIPVSLESPLSIVPNTLPGQEQQLHLPSQPSGAGQPVTPAQPHSPAQGGAPNQPANDTVTPVTNSNPTPPSLSVPEGVTPAAPQPEAPAPFPWRAVLAGVWLAGAVLMAAYALFAYLRLRRRLFDAIRARDGAWEHPAVNSPFILGVLRPKIYLPAGLAGQPRQFILCHERAHLRRLDHIVKPICWAALALHWFNPVVWAAYILMSRDIEAACDEAVIRRLGPQVKADYSATLLALATNRRVPAPCPLAFDEGDAKGRIKNVLRYRRPALWIVVVSVIAAVLAAVCLLTDPVAAKGTDDPNADPSPDASASQEPVNLADTLLDPWMKEVLDGERTFRDFYREHNSGDSQDYTIHQLRSYFYGDDQLPKVTVELGRLTIIDLDKDGINEMVIWPTGEHDDPTEVGFYTGYLILRREGDQVYGYDPGWRAFSRLKADGTFEWSGSAFDGGTGSARFTENGFEMNQITWCDNGVDKENYFVNGQKATRDEFDAAFDAQRIKPDPAWYTYADGVLAPWLPDNLELVSQTDPVSDTGEAKLWLEGGETPWLEWNGSTHRLNGLVTRAQTPGVSCRDFDGDGENEVVFSYYFNGFLQLDLYEWNGSQPVFTATYDTQQLLLRFNQNNIANYNEGSRGLAVTYFHTEGHMDDEDFYRHYVSGHCTLPEGFFDGYEHIRDGYPHAYANGFHLSYLKGDANEYYFDFEFYLADETMQELGYVDLGPDSWYTEHYMIGKPVGVTGFTLRYDGTQWRVQEADALVMDYQDDGGGPAPIPLDYYALPDPFPIPDFLNEEQQLLYRQAYVLYTRLFGAVNDDADFYWEAGDNLLEPAENVERDGFTYAAARGLYGLWDDFEQVTLSVFTRAFWDSKNTIQGDNRSASLYINVNGRMYFLNYGRGSTGSIAQTFRLVERTDSTISFVMTGYYIDPYQLGDETIDEHIARMNGDWEYYIDFPMRMVKTADGWRFDEFHSAASDCDISPFSGQRVPNPSPRSITDLAPLSAPLVTSSNDLPADPTEWYKVAELPDDMIWLYSRRYGEETLIRWDGNFYRVFYHTTHTPNCVMPQLKKLGDADHYGPLAVISHVGSGTGVSAYELVVYDLDASFPTDYFHDWKALAEDFNKNHTFRFDNDTGVMTLTYQGQTVTKTLTYEFDGVTYELLDDHDHDRIEREGGSLSITGEQVHYSFDDAGTFQLRLGAEFLIGGSWAGSLFPVDVTWTLRFNGRGFDVVPGSCVVT